FVFRGTPLLVQVFLIYYGLGQFRPFLQELDLWWFFRSPWYCVLLALTLNTAAYGAEIVRGGLQSVPAAQVEAARAYGMSGLTLYRRIIGPLALRQALPSYGNEVVLMVKATALGSTVTIMELTGIAHKLNSETFRAFEIFFVAGAIYLAINLTLTQLIAWMERRIAPDLREPDPVAKAKMAH
ncbi:MAG: ABC transporter permease, partial [Beijerinckiaceae bacterium]